MTFIHAIILGIIEGITEFLPISSTAHLILSGKLLHLPSTEFLKTFEIAIQFGAILSVVAIYPKKLLTNKESMKRIAAAFIPTAILGAILYKIIKSVFMESNPIILGALFLGGITIIIFEMLHKEKEEAHEAIETIPIKKAVAIGFFQSLAMIPGVSRSAATIIGGLLLGLKRKTIVEFSFLLAVPTMLAATMLDLYKNYQSFTTDNLGILIVGFVTSFIVAYFSIKFLLSYIQKHSFVSFGIYRIIIAIAFWIFIF